MLKLMPSTSRFIDGEWTGRNASEPDVKEYFARVLGDDAPRPEWGLPDGWRKYLAGEKRVTLFFVRGVRKYYSQQFNYNHQRFVQLGNG